MRCEALVQGVIWTVQKDEDEVKPVVGGIRNSVIIHVRTVHALHTQAKGVACRASGHNRLCMQRDDLSLPCVFCFRSYRSHLMRVNH